MNSTGKRSAAWAWLWVGLWGTFVWGLGGEDLSMDSTSRFLGPLIQWLLPSLSQLDNELAQFYVRKLAHVAEYGVLAALILRALLAGRRLETLRAALLSAGLATAFASADETRQSLSSTRLGSFLDVGLDGIGAAAGIVLLLLCRRMWDKRRPTRTTQPVDVPEIQELVSAEDTHTGTAE